MVDRTTKVFLFAIALGLWLHLVSDWTRPTPAHAQGLSIAESQAFREIARDVAAMRDDTGAMRRSLRAIEVNGLIR